MPAIETWAFLTNPLATRASPAAGGRALQRPAKRFRTGWRDQLGQRSFRLAMGVLDLQRMTFTANGLASRATHTLQARVCSRIQVCGNDTLSPPSHPLYKSLVSCLSFQAPTGPAAREATAVLQHVVCSVMSVSQISLATVYSVILARSPLLLICLAYPMQIAQSARDPTTERRGRRHAAGARPCLAPRKRALRA